MLSHASLVLATGLLLAIMSVSTAHAQQWRRVGTVDNSTASATSLCYWSAGGDLNCSSSNPRVVGGSVTVGGNAPDASAVLDVSSTTKGLLLPRVPNRDAISSPADGLLIYNSTTGAVNVRAQGGWIVLGAAGAGGSASSGASGYLQFSNGSGGFSASATGSGQQLYWDNTNYRLGIGTLSPASKLDINGGLRLGTDTADCTATNNGTLRFTSGKMQICVSLQWTDLAVVSGTAPLPTDVTSPFTTDPPPLKWSDSKYGF